MDEYTTEFPRPSKTGIYDISIPDDAPDGLRAMKEAVHKSFCCDYYLFEAAERGVRQFILGVVEETYERRQGHYPSATTE